MPAVQGADGLPVLDPALSHRAILVRTPTQQGVIAAGVIEDGQPQAVNVHRPGSAFGHLLDPADGHKHWHRNLSPVAQKRKTSDLHLAVAAR
jgi:hypothetical protein